MIQNKLTQMIRPLFILVLLCGNVQAAPTDSISYQAYLKDSDGLPVHATETVTFRIYNAADEMGVQLWSDTVTVVITDGLFSVELGSKSNPLPKASMSSSLWLGVEIGTDGEAVPRKALNSVNNAFHAEDADTLQGLSAESLIQTSDLTVHSADPSAHHTKTKDFTELTGTATDSQIPALIARDTELSTHETNAAAHHEKTTSLPWGSVSSVPVGFADGVDNDSGGDITRVRGGTGLYGDTFAGDAILSVAVPLILSGATSSSGVIAGTNNSTGSSGYGVYGRHNASGKGVYGFSGAGKGVYGKSTTGRGVEGVSNDEVGVYGYSYNDTGVHAHSIYGTGFSAYSSGGAAGHFSTSSGYGVIVESGNVGIGTSTPDSALQIYTNNERDPFKVTNLGSTKFIIKPSGYVGIRKGSPSSVLHVGGDGVGDLFSLDTSGGTTRFHVTAGGKVGIGTSIADPAARLQIDGGNDATLTGSTTGYLVTGSVTGVNIVMDNNEIMARNNGAKSKLYLNKDSSFVVVPGLEITGGADLVEPFDVASDELVLPGMVVSIDPKSPGKLRIADKEFDRTVAGIVSGANGINPGLSMAQQGSIADGSHPVALTGRLYALADATYGAIEPGDLLTTSDTPGHVMKVTDHSRAQGAIIGKAMTFLGEGKGHVLVLVSLQ